MILAADDVRLKFTSKYNGKNEAKPCTTMAPADIAIVIKSQLKVEKSCRN